MNRIYRIVFNRTLGVPQVVSELATASGSATIGAVLPVNRVRLRALAAALSFALTTMTPPVWAQCVPTAGTIDTSCAGTFSANGATGSNGTGGSPATADSGSGGSGTNAGTGGAFGGKGGLAGPYPYSSNYSGGGGGGGGAYGGGGGTGKTGSFSAGGAGGAGGNPGVVFTGSLSINTSINVAGGNGINGSSDGYRVSLWPTGYFAGGGGGGGAGISSSHDGVTIVNSGTVSGGNGGNGGGSFISGGGGGGAMALDVSGVGNQVTNLGLLYGGNGGNGGTVSTGQSYFPGSGGAGGAGLSITGQSDVTTNAVTGFIVGGQGGSGSTAGAGGVGVGISGNDNTLIDSGSISGGLDGAGGNLSAAVLITGSNNTLELDSSGQEPSNYGFIGNVVSTPGQGNVLALGGSISDTFDVSTIGGEFIGFDSYAKTGTSTWTLINAPTVATLWTINGGTLAISQDTNLGDSSGTLTLNGGTLENTASMTSTRSVSLIGSGGTFNTDAGTTLTLSGPVNGGSVTKAGAGTLILSGQDNVSGLVSVTAGALDLNGNDSSFSGGISLAGSTTLVVGGAGASVTVTGSSFTGGQYGAAAISGSNFGLINSSRVIGGSGKYGSASGAGVTGSGFTASNSGSITGGRGGSGINGSRGAYSANQVTANAGQSGDAGSDGGAGVSGTSFTLTNAAAVSGGAGGRGGSGGQGARGAYDTSQSGGAGGAGGNGGAGGAGVSGMHFGLDNSGLVLGGYGGAGGSGARGVSGSGSSGTAAGVGGNGGMAGLSGAGGAGVAGTYFNVTNEATGTITGGHGGYGGYGRLGGSGGYNNGDYSSASHGLPGAANVAGVGGAGVDGADFQLANAGAITGGEGGYGSKPGDNFTTATALAGGVGGNGGAGIKGIYATLTNSGKAVVTGGQGGVGGHGSYSNGAGAVSGAAGTGGTGGAGVTGSDFTLTNSASVTGGVGGAGAVGNTGGSYNGVNGDGSHGGSGGNGGAGVSGSSFTVINSGRVVGGAGGLGGAGGAGGGYVTPPVVATDNFRMAISIVPAGPAGTTGAGGVGVVSTGNAIVINSGAIAGGLSADGTTQADAVNFSGGNNTLELDAGYVMTGNVVSTSGTSSTGDTLALGGVTDAAFNVSQLGAAGSAVQYQGFANLAKVGSSTWTLSGTGNASEAWTVVDGTLAADTTSLVGNVTFAPTAGDTAVVAFDQTQDGTYASTASGAGSLVKTGTATLTLTGANIYSGGTTISSGTLQLGNGGTTGSITGNVTDNGALAFDRSNTLTLDGIISGTGSVTQVGSGTTVLTGANTYSGGTAISSGTLQLGNGGTTGSITGNVTDNGALAFDRSNTLTVDGIISGTGSVAQIGSGTTVLTGANTYTGGTTISGGTLQLGNGGTAGSLTGNVTDNGTLAFDHADDVSFAGQVSGAGSVAKSGTNRLSLTGTNSYTGSTSLNAGTLVLGNASAIGSGTLAMAEGTALDFASSFTLANAITLSGDPTFNVGTGLTTTLSGGISNGTQAGDLVKTGAGTLILTGANTYTGTTQAAAGTLDVEGSLTSAVSVATGATLIGSGSTGSLAVISGGLVSPSANAVGTLTVNGNVSLAAGSLYQVNATDTGSSDLIHATGTATLGGGSVIALLAGSNWNATTKYTILTAAGGITGTFGAASNNFAFLTPTLSYDANDAYLSLVRNAVAFPTVGVTPNQVQTGAAIEALGAGNVVYNAVLPMAAAPAHAGFSTLAGDSLASTRTAIIDDSHYVRDAINTHLQGVQGAGEIAQNDAQGSVWVSTWGHGGNHDSDGNAASLSSTGSGVLVGADRDLGALRLGAVAGSGQLSNNGTGASADAHSTDTVFGLYSGLDLGAWQLQGGATHSWYETRSHRQINVPTLGGFATASYTNGVTQAYVDGGYQFTFGQSSLTPYVNLARVWVHQGAITEGGNAAALTVQANGTAVNDGTVGLRGIFQPSPGLQLHANIGYQHAWGDLQSVDSQRFVNGGTSSFTVAGLPVSKNAGLLDLGIRFALSKNVSVDATYHGQFAKDATDQGARMSLNVAF